MMTAAPPRRRRRWPWVVAFVVAAVSVLPAWYLTTRWQGQRELAAVAAELDANNPNWRLPDLIATRNDAVRKLPTNSADTIAAVAKLLPQDWDRQLDDTRWHADGPPNRQPTADEADRLRAVLGRTAAALRAAGPLRDQPVGGSLITVPDLKTFMANLDLTPIQERRGVASVLSIAAAVAALDGDPSAAVGHLRAGLNAARSIGDEPTLIAQLVRIACTQVAVRSAERVLGLCQPDAELAGLQAAFEREASERFFQAGLRGELASVDQTMTNIYAGSGYSPYSAHDHASALRLLQAAVADAGRPSPSRTEYAAAEQAVMAEWPQRVAMTRLLAPAVSKVSEADVRGQAYTRAAAVAVACERHRRATGSWPTALADIPKSVLAEVPADPFDGQPIRYKRTTDGAVVYSVGPNRADDGGQWFPTGGPDGDIVFRLFDPAARRLQALPPAPPAAP